MYKKITNTPWKTFDFPDFCYWNNVFNDEELKSLNNICSTLELKKGEIGNKQDVQKIDTNVRNSNISFIDYTDDASWIFEKFNSIIESVNENFYNFDLIGYKSIQYSEYDSEEFGEYKFHMDLMRGKNFLTRKLSISFLLNDDFEGGDFLINFDDESNPVIVPTQKNRAIFFPSFLIHRVAPVTRGVRKSLVIWVLGPKFR